MKLQKINRFAIGIGAIIFVLIISLVASYVVSQSSLGKLEREAENYISSGEYGPASTIYARLYTKTGDEKYKVKRDDTIKMKTEAKVYEQGINKLDEGDYLSAIRIFNRIDREESQFNKQAKEKLKEAESNILNEVKQAMDDDNVYLASSILKDYVKMAGETEESKKLLQRVNKAVGEGEEVASEDGESDTSTNVADIKTEELPEDPKNWVGKTVKIQSPRSNLRQEPNLEGKVVGLALSGDPIQITKVQNDGSRMWCYGTITNLRNGKSIKAWISSKNL